jgi:hypothetical protein
MKGRSFEDQKSTGMCLHGNFPSRCATCKQEQETVPELKEAKDLLSKEDFEYVEKLIENKENGVDGLFDLSGKVMHTTPDHAFKKILESGRLLQDIHLYGDGEDEKGVYLTDADSEQGLTYHTLWDDAKSPNQSKEFSSAKYFDQVQDLAEYFWSNEESRKSAMAYVQERNPEAKIESQDDLIEFFQNMREVLSQGTSSEATGVTLIFDKDELPETSKKGTNELNQHWEQRIYTDEGVDVSLVQTIFVPENKIPSIREMVRGTSMEDVEIRPSEELEVIRTLKKIAESAS